MKDIWKIYDVELQFTGPFAASLPRDMKEITAMLEARKPEKKPENATPIPELAEEIADEVESTPEVQRGYATFPKDDNGIYYEARCVRGHLKDCSNILQGLLKIKALKSKFCNRTYVQPMKLYLAKKEVDGTATITDQVEGDHMVKVIKFDGNETRIIHAMTMQGPRSSFKTIDFVRDANLKFQLKVLKDGIITDDILETIFAYGGTHGMGQERGAGDFGKYDVVKLEEVK